MPNRTTFKRLRCEGLTVLRVRGDIDIANAEFFKSALLHAAVGSSLVAIDLRECAYMDSSGLAVLISVYKALGLTVIVHEDGFLRRLFRIAGVEDLFAFFTSIREVETPKRGVSLN